MADYSIADAKNNLPKLVDRAVAGEEVTITRRGKPLVKMVPTAEPKGLTIDVEWLDRVRIKPSGPNADADDTSLVELMRRESRY
jgi:prevent-host-death family protein